MISVLKIFNWAHYRTMWDKMVKYYTPVHTNAHFAHKIYVTAIFRHPNLRTFAADATAKPVFTTNAFWRCTLSVAGRKQNHVHSIKKMKQSPVQLTTPNWFAVVHQAMFGVSIACRWLITWAASARSLKQKHVVVLVVASLRASNIITPVAQTKILYQYH